MSERGEVAGDRSFRALVLLLVVSAPVLWHQGRNQWFARDEWDFLIARDLADPGSLLGAWYGHCVVLPAVAYRLLFEVWGASTYRPYQVLGIAGHFAVAAAVWALARRLGVRGWIAVVAVAPLLLLGAGRVNILFGFQITMTAALALSLAHLLLADHDGPWSRRDAAGLLCGGAAMLCSGVAVAGTIGVGVAVLLRRGRWLAVAHTVPLAVAWALWSALAPRRGLDATTRLDRRSLDFVVSLPKAALGGLGRSEPVAFALGALAVLGVVMAVRRARGAAPGGPWVASVAPLAGCLATLAAFVVLTASQRLPGIGHRVPTEGRYVYVVVALVLPLIALGVEAVARWHRSLAAVPLVVLLVGVPGNLRQLDAPLFGPYDTPALLLALAHSEQLAEAPSRPIGALAVFGLASTDDLREVAALPGLPGNEGTLPEVQLAADVLVGLSPGPGGDTEGCRLLESDRRRLEGGDHVEIAGSVQVRGIDGPHQSPPLRFDAPGGGRLTAASPISVEIVRTPYSGPRSGVYDCAAGQ